MLTVLPFPFFDREPAADQPNAITSRNNLAKSYLAAGRTAEAIPLFQRTLADCKRELGADHPTTLRARNNLAMSYLAAGRSAEATRVLERTLADCERVLGVDHPDTKAVRESLTAAKAAHPPASPNGRDR